MAITENKQVDLIQILSNGAVQYRVATLLVDEDGNEVGRGIPWRSTLSPGDDLSGIDPRVAAQARAAWTPEVLAAYQGS